MALNLFFWRVSYIGALSPSSDQSIKPFSLSGYLMKNFSQIWWRASLFLIFPFLFLFEEKEINIAWIIKMRHIAQVTETTTCFLQNVALNPVEFCDPKTAHFHLLSAIFCLIFSIFYALRPNFPAPRPM